MAAGSTRNLARRSFLALSGLGGTALLGGHAGLGGLSAQGAVDPWQTAADIVARIRRPSFPPNSDFPITAYGAVGNGTTDCTGAIKRAVTACNQAGGGRVVVPAGRFLTGAILLRRNVNLNLAAGATLLFSTNTSKYPLVRTRFEGNDCYNFSPLIYAYNTGNIAITGSGTLDGQASNQAWWPWRGDPAFGWQPGQPTQFPDSNALRKQGEDRVPVANRVYGAGHYLRPPFIQFHSCTRAMIEGVTIRNSPSWVIHPVLCTSLTIKSVTVASLGPNNDGCDPECCGDVLIDSCTFDTGDDCIAIKSGRGQDGFVPGIASRFIVIRNCEMRRGVGGIAIGSEMSGGVNNVFAENIRMTDGRLARGLFMKSNTFRGGTAEHIHLRSIGIAGVQDNPIRLTYYYLNNPLGGPYQPFFRDINVSNLTCSRSGSHAFQIRGYPANKLGPVRLTDCTFTNAAQANPFLENVQGLTLTRVSINGRPI